MPRFAVRIGRRAALLALSVCAVELGLQTAGTILTWREARAASGARWRRAEVRILCLGESTTAPTEHSWPLQLERLLDKHTRAGRYAVINAAHGATTSGILLARLPSLLDRYRPQIVITMMGVNDSRWFGIYEERALSGSRWRRWAARLKLPKLVEYAYQECWLSPGKKRGEADFRRLNEADAEFHQGRRQEAELVYRRILGRGDGSTAATAAGVRLVNTLSSDHVEAAAEVYATIAARESIQDGEGSLGHSLRFTAADKPSPDRGNASSVVTAENYRRMGELLRARGARLVAMQYPTLPIERLERLTAYPPGTLFIGNENNFRTALRRRRYADLFVDRFAGAWGHCTAEGDRLIAENVYHRLMDAGLFP